MRHKENRHETHQVCRYEVLLQDALKMAELNFYYLCFRWVGGLFE